MSKFYSNATSLETLINDTVINIVNTWSSQKINDFVNEKMIVVDEKLSATNTAIQNVISKLNLSNLNDVNITTKSDGQFLVFSTSQNKWINKTINFSTSFSSLTDVDTTGVQDGFVIQYSSTNKKYIAKKLEVIQSMKNMNDFKDIPLENMINGATIVWSSETAKFIQSELKTELKKLNDVDTSNLLDNTYLFYDGITKSFRFKEASTTSSFKELKDVDMSDVQQGSMFIYDSLTKKMKPVDSKDPNEGLDLFKENSKIYNINRNIYSTIYNGTKQINVTAPLGTNKNLPFKVDIPIINENNDFNFAKIEVLENLDPVSTLETILDFSNPLDQNLIEYDPNFVLFQNNRLELKNTKKIESLEPQLTDEGLFIYEYPVDFDSSKLINISITN